MGGEVAQVADVLAHGVVVAVGGVPVVACGVGADGEHGVAAAAGLADGVVGVAGGECGEVAGLELAAVVPGMQSLGFVALHDQHDVVDAGVLAEGGGVDAEVDVLAVVVGVGAALPDVEAHGAGGDVGVVGGVDVGEVVVGGGGDVAGGGVDDGECGHVALAGLAPDVDGGGAVALAVEVDHAVEESVVGAVEGFLEVKVLVAFVAGGAHEDDAL